MLSKRKYLFSTTIIAGVMAAAAPVWAQATSTTTSTSTSSNDQDQEDATRVQDVVVTGSRIRGVYNSPSPVQVVTKDDSTLQGLASTSELLQSNAVTGGTSQINNLYTGFVTNGGPGANTIGLRGLGPTRTLLLLNGRRVAPAGSRGSVGSADLNVLPSALISRIEVLKDGASSIYGSDAVAGVINIVTQNDLEGVVVEGQYNATTDANGGGDRSRFSISAGHQAENYSIIGSVERYDQEALLVGDRDFARCPTQGFLNTNPSYQNYIDPLTGQPKCFSLDNGGVTINTLGLSSRAGIGAAGSLTPGALGTFNRFRPNSAITTGVVGFEGVGGTSSPNTNVRDTYDPRMLEATLFSPVTTTTAFLGVNAKLGGIELYSESLVNRRESSQLDFRQLSLDYAVGSLLLPANISGGSAFSVDQGLNGGRNVQARAFIGFGLYEAKQQVDFAKQTIGARGNLPFRDWRWDTYASYTRSKSEYTYEQFLTSELIKSLNVVVAPAGTPASLTRTGIGPTGSVTVTCAVNLTDPTAGCIPAPFLTNDTLAGRLPANWISKVVRPVTGTTEYNETVFSAGIDGSLLTLPAGPLSFFLGAEFRKADIDDTPGLDSQTGNTYNFSTAAITRGKDAVREVFGEIEAPLLRDVPFAHELSLSASARWTDYDSYGDDTTYKIGLNYAPVEGVLFRATYGTSYRAPALFEQFLGATAGFIASTNDVCNNYDATTTNPNRAANCASQGLPAGFTATSSVRVLQAGGAAAGLSAETSTNFTGGIVLTPTLPESFGRLAFAVDYYKIELDNSVSQVGAAYILSQCYNSSQAEFAARSGYCAFVSRDTATRALTVTNGYVNIATNYVEGIDYNARYTREEVFGGRISANLAVTQYLSRYSQLFPTDPIYDAIGTTSDPEYTAQFDLTFAKDQWRVRYGIDWTAATSDEEDQQARNGYSLLNDFGIDTRLNDYFLHNVSAQWAAKDFSVTVGVRNLFNAEPPSASGYWFAGVGNAPIYSGYDYYGRTAFVNLSKSF
ncbi:TonB-dependent receptor domain-containing protein [Brevundimonas sp. KM4]|uniref:TonB-dependent receptor domain-containing protein n=1 Tax=Brevundimonas sp. KM4 TaxID=1628191 RepID=UPI0005F7BB9C|nr:TonB-dependent receptor [Brevundimonas sp. KM4]KJV42400.1 TonB-dependent receptor [Brevundimonas sp. KM4]